MSTTQLSLLSVDFMGLSAATAILLTLFAGGARQAVFLAANLVFLAAMLLGPVSAGAIAVYVLLGYLLVQLVLREDRWFWPALLIYVGVFVYLRRYSFLEAVMPPEAWQLTLATMGLSFLFFKVVHVLIEARSGTLGPLEFATFCNYCLNFTTFASGPIQRYQDYAAQWHGRELAIPLTFEAHLDAVLRILVGLVKVYVIADKLLPLTTPESAHQLAPSLGGVLVNVYAYYFFLYCNFSGYCDVVIGVGSLLGIRPPENFNRPWLASNVSDYWNRWHRSLTLWLTSYVFTPAYKWLLSRSWMDGRPLVAANLALLLTMMVSGLWHGTTLNFLLWGIAHGFYLMAFRTWEALAVAWFGRAWLRAWQKNVVVRGVCVVLTFNLVAFTLILFRFDAGQSLRMLAGLAEIKVNDFSFVSKALGQLLGGS